MVKLVVLGAGNHSRRNHLPALARYAAAHPSEVELAALCDLRREHAARTAREFGFARAYDDLEAMLDREQPDGCIAITPIPVTAAVATRVIGAGVPLLMEKPPGATLGEARALARLCEEQGASVMVSVNRRFDPAVQAARAWWGERRLVYLHARMARVGRVETDFVYGTAIHAVDAMRALAGDVDRFQTHEMCAGAQRWCVVRMRFCSGAYGVLEILPSTGGVAESYALFGDGAEAMAGTGEHDAGTVRCWEGGVLVLEDELAAGAPFCVRNGTYAETTAFIEALRERRAPQPSPVEVLQSVEICARIQEEMDEIRTAEPDT
jgi:predicted dehydrogenase